MVYFLKNWEERNSVTKMAVLFFNLWLFATMTICNNDNLPSRNKLFKNLPKDLKFCQSGEISLNLVPLERKPNWKRIEIEAQIEAVFEASLSSFYRDVKSHHSRLGENKFISRKICFNIPTHVYWNIFAFGIFNANMLFIVWPDFAIFWKFWARTRS